MRLRVLTLACTAILGCAPGGEHLRCDAKDSAPSEAGLQQLSLKVSAPAPKRGEPIALEGGGDMICATRKDEKRACAGEFGWAMQPVAAPDQLDESGYNVDLAAIAAATHRRQLSAEPTQVYAAVEGALLG